MNPRLVSIALATHLAAPAEDLASARNVPTLSLRAGPVASSVE